MIEAGATHTSHITIFITPGKRLFTDDCIYSRQFWHIGIIDKLTILKSKVKSVEVFYSDLFFYLIFMIQKVKAINSQMSITKKASNGIHLENSWVLTKWTQMTHVVIKDVFDLLPIFRIQVR